MSEQFLTNADGSIPGNPNALEATRLGQFAKNAVDAETRALLVKTAPGGGGLGNGSYTSRSGSIAAGATSQQVAAARAQRGYFFFQNHSDTDMWLGIGATAVASRPSIKVPANGGFWEPLVPPAGAINVICASSGKEFTAFEI